MFDRLMKNAYCVDFIKKYEYMEEINFDNLNLFFSNLIPLFSFPNSFSSL